MVPASIANARAAHTGSLANGAAEFPLFSDAHLIGELVGCADSFSVLNTVAGGAFLAGVPSAVLRVTFHTSPTEPDFSTTNTELYHGGGFCDELASLMSLELGVRLKAGASNRWFDPGGDPKGRPIAPVIPYPDPVISSVKGRSNIPATRRTADLSTLQRVRNLSRLRDGGATALVKAARQYQEALWVCDSDSSLAWLYLVAAIETAANHWRSASDPPIELMRSSRPSLEPLLRKYCNDDNLVKEVATQLAPFMGATKKFVDFLTAYMCEPPAPRPAHSAIDWSVDELKRALRSVYDLRSRALHNGTPFPTVLSEHLFKFEDGAYAEKPLGLAASEGGGVWQVVDLPMMLWVFHHICRNALLAWWESLETAHGVE